MTRYQEIKARAEALGVTTRTDFTGGQPGYWLLRKDLQGVWPDDNFATSLSELDGMVTQYENEAAAALSPDTPTAKAIVRAALARARQLADVVEYHDRPTWANEGSWCHAVELYGMRLRALADDPAAVAQIIAAAQEPQT